VKLTDVLELDKQLPSDTHERLIELHRRWGLLTDTTYRTMTALYPDYEQAMDLLMKQIMRTEREAAHYGAPGEA
jgi:hypothetical protein